MMRLINYLLYIVTLFVFLAIIVPYGLFETTYKQAMTLNDPINQLKQLADPNFNIVGSLVSFFIFTFSAIAIVFVQQWLWTTNIQKHNEYQIQEKYLKKYKISAIIALLGIGFIYFWFFTTWSINITYNPTDKETILHVIKIRRILYITGIVIIALIGFGSVGYSAYINLMISYQQQISFVDDMVAKGEYDPVTREPYKDVEIKTPDTKDITIKEYDNKTSTDEYVGSSGMIVNNSDKKIEKQDE